MSPDPNGDDLPNGALAYGVEEPLPAPLRVADSRAVSPGLLQLVGAVLMDRRFFTDAIGQTLVTSVARLPRLRSC